MLGRLSIVTAFCNIGFLRHGNGYRLVSTWAQYLHLEDSSCSVKLSCSRLWPPLGKWLGHPLGRERFASNVLLVTLALRAKILSVVGHRKYSVVDIPYNYICTKRQTCFWSNCLSFAILDIKLKSLDLKGVIGSPWNTGKDILSNWCYHQYITLISQFTSHKKEWNISWFTLFTLLKHINRLPGNITFMSIGIEPFTDQKAHKTCCRLSFYPKIHPDLTSVKHFLNTS